MSSQQSQEPQESQGAPDANKQPKEAKGQKSSKGRRQEKQQDDDSAYWTSAHSTHRLRFHLVWIPKYRKRVLEGAIATRLEELFVEACEVNGWQLHELSIQPDHVHLLLQISPRESVSKVVNLLKGGSSRRLRKEFVDLEEFLWGDSFWCDGYFAESVGQTQEGVIRRYIRNQGLYH